MLCAFFLFGTMTGRFLNVFISRIPAGASVFDPSLHCAACGVRLKGLEMVPVLSWLWLRGRCWHCRARIPVRHPLVELLTGLVFAGLYAGNGLQPTILGGLVLAAVLIVAAAIDLEHYRIPNIVVFFGFAAGLVYVIWSREPTLTMALLGILAGAGPLFLLAVLTEGMGGGDVKLAGMIGLYLGWPRVIPAMFLAAGTAAVTGLALMALGRKHRQDPLPFAPFMALGTLHELLFGRQVIEWYLSRF